MELERRGAQRIRRGYAENPHPDLTGAIIGGAMKVHSALGPGLLESAYEACLCRELAKSRLEFRRQVPMPIEYDGLNLDCGFRLDLLIEGKVVVEVKSVDHVLPIHESQLLTYLKIARLPVGLLLNFNISHLRNGIWRKVFRAHL